MIQQTDGLNTCIVKRNSTKSLAISLRGRTALIGIAIVLYFLDLSLRFLPVVRLMSKAISIVEIVGNRWFR